MAGTIAAILGVSFIAIWAIAIIAYDISRIKRKKPSIWVEICDEENKGKRLIRQYRKAYGKPHNHPSCSCHKEEVEGK